MKLHTTNCFKEIICKITDTRFQKWDGNLSFKSGVGHDLNSWLRRKWGYCIFGTSHNLHPQLEQQWFKQNSEALVPQFWHLVSHNLETKSWPTWWETPWKARYKIQDKRYKISKIKIQGQETRKSGIPGVLTTMRRKVGSSERQLRSCSNQPLVRYFRTVRHRI